MASAEELAQRRLDIQVIEDDFITIAGTLYAGIFTEFVKTDTNEVGGYVPNYDASFYIRSSHFATASDRPTREQEVTVTVGGETKTFTVDRVHNYPDDVAMELELIATGQ